MIQRLVLILVPSFTVSTSYADNDDQAAIELAIGAVDKFMRAFNKRDLEAVSATLNCPYLRFTSGNVFVFEDEKSFTGRKIYKSLNDSGWGAITLVDPRCCIVITG